MHQILSSEQAGSIEKETKMLLDKLVDWQDTGQCGRRMEALSKSQLDMP